MKLDLLKKLIETHSTPGDESEITALLKNCWTGNNLPVTELGKYAIFAEGSSSSEQKLTVLICAHMDSPGYIVESVGTDNISLVTLGGATFKEDQAEVVIKTNRGEYNILTMKDMKSME